MAGNRYDVRAKIGALIDSLTSRLYSDLGPWKDREYDRRYRVVREKERSLFVVYYEVVTAVHAETGEERTKRRRLNLLPDRVPKSEVRDDGRIYRLEFGVSTEFIPFDEEVIR